MKRIQAAAKLAARNGRPFAGFEALYKMAAVIFFAPLLLGGFALAMKLSGYAYLTHENIGAFLCAPLTLLILALILLALGVYITVDISAVAFTLDQSFRGATVTQGQILRFSLRNAARLWRPRNIPLALAALFLLPLVHIGFASGVLTAVTIPRLLLRYLRNHPIVPLSLAAAALLITVLGLRWRYGIFCFAARDCDAGPARKQAVALGRGGFWRDAGLLLAAQAVFAGLYMLFLLAFTAAASSLGKWLAEISQMNWLSSSVLWLGVVLALSVIAGLAVPMGYGCVGVLYHRALARTGTPEVRAAGPTPPPADPRRRKRARLLWALSACLLAAGSLTLGFLLSTGGINPDIEYLRTTEITAHRGASALFPENTMAAFTGARDLGADWIELDVQQSKDGQLVVTHDTNLKRTTGVNANTWDLTYDEIAALDAGSSFSPEYAGERIPLLSEALAFARESGMRLNIELKPTGHETDLEKDVVDAIRAAEMEDACVVTSQAYRCLEALKAYDETIPTVYVMRLALGRIDRLAAADFFSVEATSVTRSLVTRVHNAGKGLYVWTVNSRKSILKMIELRVDNIITDNIDLAKQCVYESRYGGLLEEYVDLLQ